MSYPISLNQIRIFVQNECCEKSRREKCFYKKKWGETSFRMTTARNNYMILMFCSCERGGENAPEEAMGWCKSRIRRARRAKTVSFVEAKDCTGDETTDGRMDLHWCRTGSRAQAPLDKPARTPGCPWPQRT